MHNNISETNDKDLTFIDRHGILNHLIPLKNEPGMFISYENIIKNYGRLNYFKEFHIKKYDKNGNDATLEEMYGYFYVNKNIFRWDEVIEFTARFNPELLI